MLLALAVFGCNRETSLPLPGADVTGADGIYHPQPFPHVDANGIQGNWIHITPRDVTTMLWTFRSDGSFEMDVFEAEMGLPFQQIPGRYEIDGNQLTVTGPFAGKPRVRMSMELLFEGDQVAAPVFHPLLPLGSRTWQAKMPIEELGDAGQVTASYVRTDTYHFRDDGQVEVQVSVEHNALSDLSGDGFFVIADARAMNDGGWDLSLPSVPSWNQLAQWGDLLSAPPLTRTW
jgi:hypothetical protein